MKQLSLLFENFKWQRELLDKVTLWFFNAAPKVSCVFAALLSYLYLEITTRPRYLFASCKHPDLRFKGWSHQSFIRHFQIGSRQDIPWPSLLRITVIHGRPRTKNKILHPNPPHSCRIHWNCLEPRLRKSFSAALKPYIRGVESEASYSGWGMRGNGGMFRV